MNPLQEHVLKLLDPGKQPCNCIEKYNGYWIQCCDCQNNGDLAEAAAWCKQANLYNTIEGIFKDNPKNGE